MPYLLVEPISNLSKLVTAQDSACLVLADSVYTFNDFHERKVQPSTPCGPNIRQFSFDCLPTPASELHLSEAQIVVRWKLLKADGQTIDSDTQVGICQALGVLGFQKCNVTINGEEYMPDFTSIGHSQYLQVSPTYVSLSLYRPQPQSKGPSLYGP